MSATRLPFLTIAGMLVALAAAVMFVVLAWNGASRHYMGIALAVGWLAGLAAARPVVSPGSSSALLFAFAVLGFFMFFVYETYQYEGTVRLFPLLVGYIGIGLAVLDIMSLTASRAGQFVGSIFGAAFDPSNLEGRSVTREIIVILAMCLIVALIYVVGFLISAPLVVMGWMAIAGRKSPLLTLVTGVATFLFIYGLFEVVLRYELYRGLLWPLFFEG